MVLVLVAAPLIVVGKATGNVMMVGSGFTVSVTVFAVLQLLRPLAANVSSSSSSSSRRRRRKRREKGSLHCGIALGEAISSLKRYGLMSSKYTTTTTTTTPTLSTTFLQVYSLAAYRYTQTGKNDIWTRYPLLAPRAYIGGPTVE